MSRFRFDSRINNKNMAHSIPTTSFYGSSIQRIRFSNNGMNVETRQTRVILPLIAKSKITQMKMRLKMLTICRVLTFNIEHITVLYT
jgi:hypothetical protein